MVLRPTASAEARARSGGGGAAGGSPPPSISRRSRAARSTGSGPRPDDQRPKRPLNSIGFICKPMLPHWLWDRHPSALSMVRVSRTVKSRAGRCGMDDQDLRRRFAALTRAHGGDACIRAELRVRCAPARVHAVVPGSRLAGRVCPARYAGSVDIFLEALERAAPGEVLVVDNDGRLDESSVGDLVVLDAQPAGLDGIVIWGLHRDTADIQAIGLPVFSLRSIPAGPQRLDTRVLAALASATLGDWAVDREDLVLGDDDGVLFVPTGRAGEVFTLAEAIRDTERRQAEQVHAGISLRRQVQFGSYLAQRQRTPSLSFRGHLGAGGGAIDA